MIQVYAQISCFYGDRYDLKILGQSCEMVRNEVSALLDGQISRRQLASGYLPMLSNANSVIALINAERLKQPKDHFSPE